jgi:hypothetical protein
MAFALSLMASTVAAQTCGGTLPYQLTNGQTTDATQVMANFNFLVSCVGALRGYIGGLMMSNDTGNPNQVIDTRAGMAQSDDFTTMMTQAAFVKNANSAWSSGSGGTIGCADGANGYTALAPSTWYSLFVVARTDTGVVDELCSLSPTSPALPANYTKQRRIGSFKTDPNGHILSFTQRGDNFYWHTEILDVPFNTPISSTTVTQTISVPPGIAVTALIKVGVQGTTVPVGLTVWLPSYTAALYTVVSQVANAIATVPCEIPVLAGANGTIDANTTSSAVWVESTQGWIDTRGRFN